MDQIRSISATGADGVTLIAPTISNLGGSVVLSGTGLDQVLTGTSAVNDTGAGSGAGNATITFNAPIRSFTFLLGDDGIASRNPPPQSIAIGNVNFTPVPEINPALVAAGACILGVFWRWRHHRSQPHLSKG